MVKGVVVAPIEPTTELKPSDIAVVIGEIAAPIEAKVEVNFSASAVKPVEILPSPVIYPSMNDNLSIKPPSMLSFISVNILPISKATLIPKIAVSKERTVLISCKSIFTITSAIPLKASPIAVRIPEKIPQALSAISTKINDNANNIAIQKARIDTFTTLASGSTTGDAELIDIRVKADGTTATSAGNAVREQISELNGDLDDLHYYNQYAEYPNIIESYKFEIGGYNNSNVRVIDPASGCGTKDFTYTSMTSGVRFQSGYGSWTHSVWVN